MVLPIQKMIQGLRALKGATRVEGKPGLWRIEPEQLSETAWLKRANKRMLDEGDLAESNGNHGGLRSIKGKERAKHAYMTSGALNTLRMNTEPWSRSDNIRGLVQVDKNGNVIGAAAVDTRKGATLINELDFTKAAPNYLEYIGTVSPEARGLDLMRETQRWLGDDLIFQSASPKKNVPIYESWGARLAPEIEGGVPELPYMRLEQRAARVPEENTKQLRLPGFAGGGLARLREMKTDPSTYIDAVRHAYSRNPFSETELEHARIYNRLGDELRRQYGGKSGSITDRAKNYAGGWDYATRDPENAARRAELWQFKDYVTSPFSEESRADAGFDLDENLAGIRDAMRFVGPPEPYRELKSRAVRWAEQNPR